MPNPEQRELEKPIEEPGFDRCTCPKKHKKEDGTIFHQMRKIAEITSYNFYILLKDTIKSLVINHKYLYSFFSFFIYI
jgi:hypothetical protein